MLGIPVKADSTPVRLYRHKNELVAAGMVKWSKKICRQHPLFRIWRDVCICISNEKRYDDNKGEKGHRRKNRDLTATTWSIAGGSCYDALSAENWGD